MEEIDDNEYDESNHDRLVSAISKLDKTQHIKQPSRSEPTNLTSEFNLIKSSNKLDIGDIVKVLETTSHHVQVGKKFKKSQDSSRILPKPLEKPQAERIKRATGYEQTRDKLGRWDPVVARSRTVDYVSFPLKHVSNKMPKANEFLSKFTLKSPLELELDEVDPPPAQEVENEEEKIYPMSYEEMVEHRQHLAKIRAQQSFKAAKAKRQSKIKSKKYHRILKKEKLKQQIKEFEDLQKTDPEEALKKLEALEKARALERHTLRHKNTGKWAKNLMVRAKYDKDVRQELAEQLAVSRALTKKTNVEDSSDDEPETGETIPDISLSHDPNNPWMLKSSNKSNVDAEFDFGYKKYLKDRMYKRMNQSDSESEDDHEEIDIGQGNNIQIEDLETQEVENQDQDDLNSGTHTVKILTGQLKHQKSIWETKNIKLVATSNWTVETIDTEEKKSTTNVSEAFDSLEHKIAHQVEAKLKNLRRDFEAMVKRDAKHTGKRKTSENQDNLEYLMMKNKKKKAIIDEELNETSTGEVQNTDSPSQIPKVADSTASSNTNTATNIDPSKFIEAKPKYLNTALSGANEFDEIDDEEQVVPKVNIEEVFEEDDVVASFRQEKEEEANKDNAQGVDLGLPGWGSWGGKGVKPQRRRKNRFISKAPPKMPRRDENKGDIIIKEYKDPKLASHKVTEVPFPFESVQEYEASIRAPLGNTFIPEKAHKKLIKPEVITKAGEIIQPMDEEELLVPKNRSFRNESIINLLGNK